MNTNDEHIDLCIEEICQQGCRSVNQIIERLEQDQPTTATQHLNETQQKQVLHELKNIMAVYAETQTCEV
jgi:N-methylhydantoinase B/oxoprolinase/acetone carboxylase alpha subunit